MSQVDFGNKELEHKEPKEASSKRGRQSHVSINSQSPTPNLKDNKSNKSEFNCLQIQQLKAQKQSQTPKKEHQQQKTGINNVDEIINWQAQYLDNQFYLADPLSIQKLHDLQQEITKEKHKLQSTGNHQQPYHNYSFLSVREDKSQKQKSERSHVVDTNTLAWRKKQAQKSLFEEEDRYRSKIEETKKNMRIKYKSKQRQRETTYNKKSDSPNVLNKEIEQKRQLKSQIISKQDQFYIDSKKQTNTNKKPKEGFIEEEVVKNLQLQSNHKEGNKIKISKRGLEKTPSMKGKSDSQDNIYEGNGQEKKETYQHLPCEEQNQLKKSYKEALKSQTTQKQVSKHSKSRQKQGVKSINQCSDKMSSQQLQDKEKKGQQAKMQKNKAESLVSASKIQSKKLKACPIGNQRQQRVQMKQQQPIKGEQNQKNKEQKKEYLTKAGIEEMGSGLVNKSIQWSQRESSVKSSQKKQQLYKFLNPNQSKLPQQNFNKRINNVYERSQIEPSKSSKNKKSISVCINQTPSTRKEENQQHQLQSSISQRETMILPSKHNKKSENKTFVIHVPKPKSVSDQKVDNTQSEKYSSSKKQQSNRSFFNEKLAENFESRINQKTQDRADKKNINEQIVSKSELLKLKTQMQILRKQLDFITENQQKSTFIDMSVPRDENVEGEFVSDLQVQSQKDMGNKLFKGNGEMCEQYPDITFPKIKPLSSSPIKINRRSFNIQSSIVQFNFLQQKRKQLAVVSQRQEKTRLSEQISRLKTIIRQLRLDKIKSSIEGNSITLNKSAPFEEFDKKDSLIDNEQIQTLLDQRGQASRCIQRMHEPQQIATITQAINRQDTSPFQRSQIQQMLSKLNISNLVRSPLHAGKIMKNSPQKDKTNYSQVQNPQKKPTQLKISFNVNRKSEKKYQPTFIDKNKEGQNDPLPQKNTGSFKISQPIQKPKSEFMEKVNRNQKQFQRFVQESQNSLGDSRKRPRIKRPDMDFQSRISSNNSPLKGSSSNSRIKQFLQKQKSRQMFDDFDQQFKPKHEGNPQSDHECVNYRQLNQQTQSTGINRVNLQDIEIQEIKEMPAPQLSQISIPNFEDSPSYSMSQQELIDLAKKTYRAFGIQIEKEQISGSDLSGSTNSTLTLKKYKNCVFFSTPLSNEVILWDYTGRFYMGGWRKSTKEDGQKAGQGIQQVPGKHLYKGQFFKGKKNGMGIMKYNNGNIYEGQWMDATKYGRGKYYQAGSGVIYDGEWKDNKKDGSGILRFSLKQYYEGTFVKSMKHGFGYQAFANGDQYRGEYCQGKFHGKGRYIWANQSIYEGNFIEGLRSGQGSWRSSKIGSVSDQYIGEYLNDKKNGYGRYRWTNGCTYEGNFRSDLKDGKGRLTYEDGKEVKGTWSSGDFVGTDSGKKVFENEEEPLRKAIRYSSFMIEQSSRDTKQKILKNNRQIITDQD